LPARIAAASAAERVFGYAQSAEHWQRASDLVQALPGGAAYTAGVDLARLYLRAIDAVEKSGDSQRAGLLADEAYRRCAGHPDHATAALIHHLAGYLRGIQTPDAGFPLIEESLRLFELGPPSAEPAEALVQYADIFLFNGYGRREDSRMDAAQRAAEVALWARRPGDALRRAAPSPAASATAYGAPSTLSAWELSNSAKWELSNSAKLLVVAQATS
jgi:hypothetical protein